MPDKVEGQAAGGGVARYVIVAIVSAALTLGAKMGSDRLAIEHDAAVSSVEIINVKAQLRENKQDLEKRLDALDAKFEKLREEVLKGRR